MAAPSTNPASERAAAAAAAPIRAQPALPRSASLVTAPPTLPRPSTTRRHASPPPHDVATGIRARPASSSNMLLVPFDHHMNIPRIGCTTNSSSSFGSNSPARVAQTPRPAPPPPRPSAWRAVIRVVAASVPHVATLTALALLGFSTLTFPPTSAASASSLHYVVAAAAIVAVAHVATHTVEHLRPPDPAQRERNLERLSGRRVVAAAVSVPMHALVLLVAVRAVADVRENAVLGAGVVVHAIALGIVVGRVLEVPRIDDEIHAARHTFAAANPAQMTQSRRSLAGHEDWDATESRRSSARSSVGSSTSRRASAMSLLEKLAVAPSASPSDADQVRDSTSISSRWVYGSTAVGTLTAGTTAGAVDRATRASAVLKAIKLAEASNDTNVDKNGAVGQVASSLPRGLPRGTAAKETAVPRVPTSPGGTPVAARKYVPKRRYSMSNMHAAGVHEGVSVQSLRSQAGVAHASTSSTTSPRRRESMPRRCAEPIHVPSASQSTTSTATTGRSRRASANDVPTTRRTPSATTSNLHAFMAAHHIVELMSDERLATEAQPPPSRASDAVPQAPPPTRSSSGTVTAAKETDSVDSLVASSPAPAAGRQPVPSDGRRTRSATATAASSTFRPKHVVNSCPTIVVVPPPSPVLGAVGAAQGEEETGKRKERAGMLSAETGGWKGT